MLSWGVLGLSRGACCPTGVALPLFANDKQARSLSITGTLVRGEGGIGRSPLNLMKPNRNSKHSGAHGRFGSEFGAWFGELRHPSLKADALNVDGP